MAILVALSIRSVPLPKYSAPAACAVANFTLLNTGRSADKEYSGKIPMDSMISLKKHLEAAVKQEWSPAEPGEPALEAFHALLLAAGNAGHRAVPDLGPDLREQLTA